jgi:farnesyl diphosphate synthase
MPSLQFRTAFDEAAADVEKTLAKLLPESAELEARLYEAMRYAVLGGGKRLRPFIVLECAGLFNVAREMSLRVAAAVEFIHCYSLVHDDLPCMDDDDLRRGKPTVHVAFDEATAVLVGDALLTMAFEVLADEATSADPLVRMRLVNMLAKAAGGHGMVGGQVLDLMAESTPMDEIATVRLQRMKTGELIAFSAEAGAVLGHADYAHRHALRNFAHELGLAFQIVDDLLDIEGSADSMGKATGKDADQGKATFVSLLGVENARQRAQILAEQAKNQLAPFGNEADTLRELCEFVINRNN